MNTSSSSRKRSLKSSNVKEKGQVCSSKVDENKQSIGKCLITPESKKMEAKMHSNKKKQAETLQMLMQKMKTTNEELKYRLEKSKDVNVVEKYSKFFKCTKCQKNYRPVLNKYKKLDVHPILGVLMCFDCRSYYGDGNFSMDSDGEDKYCRWCGEGGTLFSCSKCICGFCDICIRRHFGNEFLKNVEKDDDWVCFFCNPQPLWHLRFISSVAEQAAKKHNEPFEKNEKLFSKSPINYEMDESSSDEAESNLTMPIRNQPERHRNNIYTTSSDDSDEENPGNSRKRLRFSNNSEGDSPSVKTNSLPETNKFQAVKNLEKILKLTEYQMGLGLDWSKKKFNKLKTVNDKTPVEKVKKECQKIKWFISVISSYLVGFCNSIDSVEKSLGEEQEETRSFDNSTSANNHLTFTNIIQFLGFVTNQVKTFSEKGITLQDLLQAELYEDANVLGFKKSSNSNSSHTTSKKSPPDSSKPMEEGTGGKNDDNQATAASGKNKNIEENLEISSNSEGLSPEIGSYTATKDDFRGSTPKSDKKKTRKDLGKLSPKKDLSAAEKNSPDINQFKLDWRSSVNGEDVQDILTILESA